MSPSTATPMNDPAFDHAPCALLVLDPDGQALRVNRACRQLLAWSTDDALTGRHLSVLLRLEDDDTDKNVRQFSVYVAELFVDDMDGQLRQNGVGDLIVGKHIGKMMSALGGRLGAYRTALATGDGPQLEQALRRNLYRDAPVADAAVTASAGHLLALYARLKTLPVQKVMQGEF